jgi:predicted Holliday junction resolvase-like endonuclease
MGTLLRVLGILLLIGGGISAAYNSIILFEGEPYVKKSYVRVHSKAKALEQEIQKSGASAERSSKSELVKKYEEALKEEQMWAGAVKADEEHVRRSKLLTIGSVVIGAFGLLLVILSFIGRGKKEELALPFGGEIAARSL